MQAVMQTIARMRPAGPCPDCRLDPPPCEPGAANATFCPLDEFALALTWTCGCGRTVEARAGLTFGDECDSCAALKLR